MCITFSFKSQGAEPFLFSEVTTGLSYWVMYRFAIVKKIKLSHLPITKLVKLNPIVACRWPKEKRSPKIGYWTVLNWLRNSGIDSLMRIYLLRFQKYACENHNKLKMLRTFINSFIYCNDPSTFFGDHSQRDEDNGSRSEWWQSHVFSQKNTAVHSDTFL